VDLPAECVTIGASAFLKCCSLRRVELKGVHRVDDDAFAECTRLRDLGSPGDLALMSYSIRGTAVSALVASGELTVECCGARCSSLERIDAPLLICKWLGIADCQRLQRVSLLQLDGHLAPYMGPVPGEMHCRGDAAKVARWFRDVMDAPSVFTFWPSSGEATSGGLDWSPGAPPLQCARQDRFDQKVPDWARAADFRSCRGHLTAPTGGIGQVHVVYLPSHLSSLPPRAFALCPWLRQINTGDCLSLRAIGSHCFSGCLYLTSLVLPDSLAEWDESSFSGSGLTVLLCGHLRCRIAGVEGGTWLRRLVLPLTGPEVRLSGLPRLCSASAPSWAGEVVTDCLLRATSFRSPSVWVGQCLLLAEVAYGGRESIPATPP
jgi:hypothetical protein